MDLTTVYDCTGQALGTFPIPPGVLMAGYVTGSSGVPWTPHEFALNPGAIRIDQSPADTPADELADVIDMEQDAATLADLADWVHAAWNNWTTAARPGQRTPTVYCSTHDVTPVVNELLAAGITRGVNLWIAEQATAQQATAEVQAASGPFPVIGRQYEFHQDHDVSVVSSAWLANVSGKPAPPAQGLGTQAGWRHCLKCTSLFYGPQQAQSHCAAGGAHDGSQSHDFTLGFFE